VAAWAGCGAHDEVLHRDVAVKEVVPPDGLTGAERDELRVRTMREARAAARLIDPHVVRVYDVIEDERCPWIVLEYVPSRSLHQVMTEDGPLPVDRVAQIGLAVLAALRAAHQAGVVHRDVKPGNVLLADDGRVVLTDFGLAVFDGGDGSMTRPGTVLGSPQYIAPERARGSHSGPEADLWSLGATLYAAVEGRSPYARVTTLATLAALVTEAPDPPRRAGALTPVLAALLRKDPGARPSLAQAERLLRRAASGRGPAPRRRRTVVAAVAGVAAVLAVAAAVSMAGASGARGTVSRRLGAIPVAGSPTPGTPGPVPSPVGTTERVHHGTTGSPSRSTYRPPLPVARGHDAYATIQAESYDRQSGVTLEPTADAGGGQDITSIGTGDWVLYRGVDFGTVPATQFVARIAGGAPAGVGGRVEVRLDSLGNAPVGSAATSSTGGWQRWLTVPANIAAVTGVHDVYLTFSSAQTADWVSVNWLTFGHY
jgi:Protein kinase domain/Carbohydrate binding module (family 6)